MKPIGNLSYFDPFRLPSDLTSSFEKLWHELDRREEASTDPDDRRKVRLRCTGKRAPIGSIVLFGARAYPRGGQSIEFTRPRCDEPHESRLFRRAGLRAPAQDSPRRK